MKNNDKNAGADALASKDGLGIVIQTLNEAFQADPNAICALIAMRVPCNQKLADHPTIQVGGQPDMVGMLGIINGIVERMTGNRVAAIYGDDSKLEGFTEKQRSETKSNTDKSCSTAPAAARSRSRS